MEKRISEEDLSFFAAQVADKIKHTESSKETKALISGIKEQITLQYKDFKNQIEDLKGALEEANEKFASKWTEKAILTLMFGTFAWVANQLLSLIPTVKAFFN